MSPVEVNTKSVVLVTLGASLLLYAVYTKFPAKSKAVQVKSHTSWKTTNFVDIPKTVIQQASDVKVQERHLAFEIDGQVRICVIFAQEIA